MFSEVRFSEKKYLLNKKVKKKSKNEKKIYEIFKKKYIF